MFGIVFYLHIKFHFLAKGSENVLKRGLSYMKANDHWHVRRRLHGSRLACELLTRNKRLNTERENWSTRSNGSQVASRKIGEKAKDSMPITENGRILNGGILDMCDPDLVPESCALARHYCFQLSEVLDCRSRSSSTTISSKGEAQLNQPATRYKRPP